MNGEQIEILMTLKEILKWVRLEAAPNVKAALENMLTKAEHRRLYQALDGKKTQKQLAEAFGITQPRVSQLVTAWQRAGIVDEVAPGKYARAFNLEDLGIEIEVSEG